jgi:ribonuclease P protein component
VIARKNRFHGHNSVSRVRGKPVYLSGFKVFYSRNHKRKDYRMAVVVSKKTAKSAVVRNRIRRRLYEAVRVQGTLNNQPYDVVFAVQNPDLATTDAQELSIQVQKALTIITDQS